jgi:site-specific recombinase XerD
MLRVSEMTSIDRKSVVFSENSVSFSLCKPRKSQRAGPLRSLTVRKLGDQSIDPVHCLGLYVHSTDTLISGINEHRLLIGSMKPHKAVSGSTVARWIKNQLEEAGVDTSTFSAHSTRGAAASKAAMLGVPIQSILSAADWTSESNFSRFYRREVAEPTVAELIMTGYSI